MYTTAVLLFLIFFLRQQAHAPSALSRRVPGGLRLGFARGPTGFAFFSALASPPLPARVRACAFRVVHCVSSVVYLHWYDPVFRSVNEFLHWVVTTGFWASTSPR
eukprot:192722-Pyramimonas_sp.AAC.1